jgi:lipoic acid synthetase
VEPKRFDELAVIADELGFLSCASGPLVRSSYRASEFYARALQKRAERV